MNTTCTLLLATLLLSAPVLAQDAEDDIWDMPERSGFVFGLNLGGYFANKGSAVFYNGTAAYDINDAAAQLFTIEERLFLNELTVQNVSNLINAEAYTIPFDSPPMNMRYNPSLVVGFHVGYRFNNENGIFLDANFTSLTASDQFTLVTNLQPDPSQGTSDIRLYSIIGQEDRMNINLGYRAGIVINETMNWYFEGGGSFLATRVNENFLEIEGSNFDLMIGTQFGPNNLNGPTSNLTATGLGWYAGTGVEAFFDEKYEASLGVRMCRDQVIVGGPNNNPDVNVFQDRLSNWQVFISFSI